MMCVWANTHIKGEFMSDRGGIGRGFQKLVGHVREISNKSKGKDIPPLTPRMTELKEKKARKGQTRDPSLDGKKMLASAKLDREDANDSTLRSTDIKGYRHGIFFDDAESGEGAESGDVSSIGNDGGSGEEASTREVHTPQTTTTTTTTTTTARQPTTDDASPGKRNAVRQRNVATNRTSGEVKEKASIRSKPRPTVPRLNIPEPTVSPSPRTVWTPVQPQSARRNPQRDVPPREPQEKKTVQSPRQDWAPARPSARKAEQSDVKLKDLPPLLTPQDLDNPQVVSPRGGNKKS
jgi:hypothetical protein